MSVTYIHPKGTVAKLMKMGLVKNYIKDLFLHLYQ